MTYRTVSDSTTADDVDPNADLKGGYVDGRYRTAPPLIVKFGAPNVVTLTVLGANPADGVDVEAGDASIPTGCRWAADRVKTAGYATIYCTAAAWPAVRRELRKHLHWRRRRRVHYWIADYDGKATIPRRWRLRRCVAKQYASSGVPAGQPGHAPGHQDRSVAVGYWPGVDPVPLSRWRRRQVASLARYLTGRHTPVGRGRDVLAVVEGQAHRVLNIKS